ncbi:MAG: hypothetical protein H0X72_05935 [Acidobacteria bacterium]|jgi:hypothetical protein|nr:hypothetical protein [Acidobacteriota bacterium]
MSNFRLFVIGKDGSAGILPAMNAGGVQIKFDYQEFLRCRAAFAGKMPTFPSQIFFVRLLIL